MHSFIHSLGAWCDCNDTTCSARMLPDFLALKAVAAAQARQQTVLARVLHVEGITGESGLLDEATYLCRALGTLPPQHWLSVFGLTYKVDLIIRHMTSSANGITKLTFMSCCSIWALRQQTCATLVAMIMTG